MTKDCNGSHRIFVPDVVGVESEGKVYVICVCTACCEVTFHEKTVASPGAAIRLLKTEKEKENVPL